MSAPQAPAEPFVMVPLDLLALVADGKLSKNAAWLYVLLLTHLNQARGDTKVWPSRRRLAERMNLGQTRGVDRYIAELEAVGLIARDRRRDGRVNDTNLYTLLVTSAGGGAPQSTTRPPATARDSAGRGVVRSSALPSAQRSTRGSAPQRTGVVRHSAPELDQGNIKEGEQDPSLSGSAVSSPSGEREPAGERDDDPQEPEPQDLRQRFVMRHGATADEAARVVADIQAEHRPRGNGWWRKVDQEGDLGDIVTQALARVRAPAAEPAAVEQLVDVAALILAARRDGPHCDEHAAPGGRFLHPIHGSPLCPYCRRGLPPTTTRQETTSS